MSSEMVQALDRLRDAVDSLRRTIEATAGEGSRPAEVYLDDLQRLSDSGLITEAAYMQKRTAYLGKI